jgi:hypothetical protein
MYGIPGLRARHKRGRTVLSRPGIHGRIIIPVTADRWHKAVMVAAALRDDEGGTCSPWLTHPRGWHPAEARWAATWPGRYSPDNWQYRNTWFASQILRRLRNFLGTPRRYLAFSEAVNGLSASKSRNSSPISAHSVTHRA